MELNLSDLTERLNRLNEENFALGKFGKAVAGVAMGLALGGAGFKAGSSNGYTQGYHEGLGVEKVENTKDADEMLKCNYGNLKKLLNRYGPNFPVYCNAGEITAVGVFGNKEYFDKVNWKGCTIENLLDKYSKTDNVMLKIDNIEKYKIDYMCLNTDKTALILYVK